MKIQLDSQTMQILKNYAKINPTIIIRKGNVLTTKKGKTLFSHSVLDNTYFPKEFTIYDLNTFLSVVTSFKDPEFDFSEDSKIIITSNGNSVEYWLAASGIHEAMKSEVRKRIPERVTQDTPIYSFTLQEDELKVLINMCNTLSLDLLEITSKEIVAKNKDNKSNNIYRHTIQSVNHIKDRTVYLDMSNILFISGTYEVNVYDENLPLVYFRNNDMNLDYLVGEYIGG